MTRAASGNRPPAHLPEPPLAGEREDLDAGEVAAVVGTGAGVWHERAVFWIGVAVSLFHIYATTVGTVSDITLTALHWGGFGLLCALTVPMWRGGGRRLLAFDTLLGLLALACGVYVIWAFEAVYARGVHFIWSDWVFSILAVALALGFARPGCSSRSSPCSASATRAGSGNTFPASSPFPVSPSRRRCSGPTSSSSACSATSPASAPPSCSCSSSSAPSCCVRAPATS
jgi:hypothetical protein